MKRSLGSLPLVLLILSISGIQIVSALGHGSDPVIVE